MTAPGLMQVCSRCGTTWPVALGENGPVSARWCPYCNGDLYAPSPIRAADPAASPHTPPPPTSPPHPGTPQMPQAPPAPGPQSPPSASAPVHIPGPVSVGQTGAHTSSPAATSGVPHARASAQATPRPAPPQHQTARLPRGYRWRARSPEHPADPPPVGPPPPAGPTPRYTQTPQWGLPIRPRSATEDGVGARTARWAQAAPDLLRLLAAVLVAVVAAEGFRYLLLLLNQGRALPAGVVWLSDAMVYTAAVVAIPAAAAATIACAAWLIRARIRAYRRLGARDPRSPGGVLALCLIPGCTVIGAGVALTELEAVQRARSAEAITLAAPDSRPLFPPAGRRLSTAALVRWWWLVWVWTNLTALGAVLMRLDTSAQGRADAILAAIVAAGAGLVAIAVTAATMRRLAGQGPAAERRWVRAGGSGAPAPTPPRAAPAPTGASADADDAGAGDAATGADAPLEAATR